VPLLRHIRPGAIPDTPPLLLTATAESALFVPHPDTGQGLLDGRRRAFALQLLDIGRDVHGLHVLQPANAAAARP
jgi:hypothetical protein